MIVIHNLMIMSLVPRKKGGTQFLSVELMKLLASKCRVFTIHFTVQTASAKMLQK